MRTQRASGRLYGVAWMLVAGIGVLWSPAAHAGTIQACVSNSSGQFRLMTHGGCKSNETALNWNMQGPKGDQGDPGAPGAAGLSGLERIDYSSTADSESPKKAFAKCPTGKQVVGGGAQVFIAGTDSGPVALRASYPSSTLDGWAATAEEMVATDLKWFVTAFALCATVTPTP